MMNLRQFPKWLCSFRMRLGPIVLALLAAAPGCFAQDPGVQVVSVEVDDVTNRFRITLIGQAGEFLVECSDDLQSWGVLCHVGSDGATPVEVSDPITPGAKYFRVASIPETDGFHLNGAFAQELRTTLVYGDLQTVFGLGLGPAPATPSVLELPSAARDTRLYSAIIATLSVMAQALRDSIVPAPSEADIVAALATDLASGNLDGRDSGGSEIEIGLSGVFLPDYTELDVTAALAQLKNELGGLGNVFLQGAGGGQFAPSVPGNWGYFYWDSADWQ